jgi:predicted kinase
MKKVIIFAGALAALKSTISRRLADELNVVCLNKDTIKEQLGDHISYSTREENKQLSTATFHVMNFTAKEVLKRQDTVILESNFKPHEVEVLDEWADLVIVNLTGDPKVLSERYNKRNEERHEVHKSTGVLDEKVFEYIVKECLEFDFVKRGKTFDTTTFRDEDYTEIKEYIMNELKV